MDRILVFPAVTEAEAFAMEKTHIRFYGRKDIDTGILRNLTDGGEGTAGTTPWNSGRPMSDESKQKLSRSQKGHWHPQTLEARIKISVAHRGKIVSSETRKKQSDAKKGKPSTWKGHHPSEGTRQKMRLAKLGRKLSEETKMRMRGPRRQYKPRIEVNHG